MANSYKDIIITPNRSSSTADPKIEFRGGNTTVNTAITLQTYPTSNGTLSFEGSAGQLLSITNDMSGSIYSVNDVSGIPAIEVFANGQINFAQFGGAVAIGNNVGIGVTSPTARLDIMGTTSDQIRLRTALSEEFRIGRNSSTGFLDFYGTQSGYTGYQFGGVDGTHMSISALGITTIASTSDYQVILSGRGTSWAGILFSDVDNSDALYYRGSTSTFAIGGGGSTVTNKKLHVNGAMTVGSGIAASAVDVNTLYVEGYTKSTLYYDAADTNYYVDPAGGSRLGGNVQFDGGSRVASNGDITARRDGGSTGVVYFADGTPYLYWNGGSYIFSSTGYVSNGISIRAPIFYDTDNTGYYWDGSGTSYWSTSQQNGWHYFNQNYGHGIVGLYASTRFQCVYAMGDAYKGNADGTSLSGAYGLWWSYPSAGGPAASLSSHGLMCIVNGTNVAQLDSSTRANGDMRAPIFYDLNNTGYYWDGSSVTNINELNVQGRQITQSPSVYTAITSVTADTAPIRVPQVSVGASAGFVPALSQKTIYSSGYVQHMVIGNYRTAAQWGGGMFIGLGGNDSYPTEYFLMNYGGSISHTNGYVTIDGQTRSPIYYDSNNTGFYFDGASTSIANNVQITTLGVGTAASGTTGEIRATNNITAYYSDERLKTRLGNIPNAVHKVMCLSGFYYEPNEVAQALGYEKKREIGVSAQEVEAVFPEIVAPAPIDDKYLTVRYEKLVAVLIEAVKEQQAHINKLEQRITTLEGK